jgi:hypothetical protein
MVNTIQRGGLNQMTVARFGFLVAASAFVITKLDLVPIRAPFAARKAKAARLTRIQKGRFEDGLFAN